MIFCLSLVERIVAFGLGSAVQTSCEQQQQQQNFSNLHALLLCGAKFALSDYFIRRQHLLGVMMHSALAAVSGHKIYVYT